MPYINGKFYMNPAFGRALEVARDAESAGRSRSSRGFAVRYGDLDARSAIEEIPPASRSRGGGVLPISNSVGVAPQNRTADGRWVTIDHHHVFIAETRGRIVKTAQKYNGSTDWAFNKRKDNFPAGTNKCNKFVYDITKEAGAPALVVGNDGKPRPPLAAEWADPRVSIPSWQVLGPAEKPEAGDVAAWPNHYSDATGHSGIVVSVDPDGQVTAIAAHSSVVGSDGSFNRSRHPRVTYRRYVGR
ncbi:MAG: CHAP domain-containing protein [Candidatus Acidiferrales bacterium]